MFVSTNQTDASSPFGLGAVAWFVAAQLGGEQIRRGGHREAETTDLGNGGAIFPSRRHFTQDSVRHEVNMPAVLALELAADQPHSNAGQFPRYQLRDRHPCLIPEALPAGPGSERARGVPPSRSRSFHRGR